MHINGEIIQNFIIVTIFLCWITYSVAVIIYLNYLTRRYLLPAERDIVVGDKLLKTHSQILKQFEGNDEINVLILTGGGLRGLVPLYVLSYIEEKTGKKIGELFDFAAGSSTGAISVASLMIGDGNGGYKFSATEVRDNYYNHASRIFSSPWYHQFLTMFGLFAPRFLPDGKIKVLEEFFGDATLGELKGNILIPVYNIDENNLQLVKNWNPPHGNSNDNYLTRDLINGASSPPMLFPPVAFRLKGRNHLFIDPAVILNNPILQVLLQLQILFPNKKLNMVLIGNGGTGGAKYDYRSMFEFGLYGIYQYLFSAPALSSKLYIDFLEQYLQDASHFNDKISYFRVNNISENSMSPTNTGERNMQEIIKFADKMLNENKELIDKITHTITKNRNYNN